MLSAKNLKVSVVKEDRKKNKRLVTRKRRKRTSKRRKEYNIEDIEPIYNKYNNTLTRKHVLIHSLPEIIINLLWFA